MKQLLSHLCAEYNEKEIINIIKDCANVKQVEPQNERWNPGDCIKIHL